MEEKEEKELDLKKIEEDAFSAIDELFSETPSEIDPRISRLEESILSLDWEFSDKDLSNLRKTIEELKGAYADKFNNILLAMMGSITKFLTISKELAPSDTLNILGKIAKTFKEINTTALPEREKRQKVRKVYTLFIQLRDRIPSIKKAVQAEEAKPPKPPEVAPEEVVSTETREIKPEVQAKERPLTEMPGVQPETPVAAAATPVPEELANRIETGFSMLERLIQSLNDTLESKVEQTISQIQHLNAKISDFLKQIEEINAKFVIMETFKSEFDLLKEKITHLENIFIQQKEAVSERKVEPEPIEEKPQIKEAPPQPELKTEIPEESETKELPVSETWPYVLVFSLEEKLIALPLNNIANIYPVSPKKAKSLIQRDSILLKEFKSFWRKLSKNMKGELKNLKEKDLKNLEVPVLKLSWEQTEDTVYNTAVLLQYNGKYGILFLNKMIFEKPYLSETGNKIGEKEIEAEIETPKGMAYLINPAYLLKGE
ncbi:MAG: hypothetical protein KCCBMMGE_01212 [Candidatus Methanoperedenaceae archaeon GB37]|nr:MAG: hypothetical protein KCCBMMGE_01212 [Candidatus Methanoperedenaceae archaeon GB37]